VQILYFTKYFLPKVVYFYKVCHPTKLENPVLLDEPVLPSTKYGMALTFNVIFNRDLHGINTELFKMFVWVLTACYTQ